MQHANQAIDEVRRAEFFRKGGAWRDTARGKLWLLLSRWVNLHGGKQQLLNDLFRLNRRLLKAGLPKVSLDRLWSYLYEGSAKRYLNQWIGRLRWHVQRDLDRLFLVQVKFNLRNYLWSDGTAWR